jgi:hypothetical protein
VLKKLYSSRALFSELLGSTVFIRPRAVGTHGAPGAALHRQAGARAQGTCAGLGAALSWEVGTGAAGTRGAPGVALGREVGIGAAGTRGAPGAARADLLLVVSGNFFLVASYCPTSRVLKKPLFFSVLTTAALTLSLSS